MQETQNVILIPKFIIISLQKYGNVAIGRFTFQNINTNKQIILNQLKALGLNCQIKEIAISDADWVKRRNKPAHKLITYRIELIK